MAARAPIRPDENCSPSSSDVLAATGQNSDADHVDRDESAQCSPDPYPSDDLPMDTEHTHPSALDAAAFERGLTHSDSLGREEVLGNRLPELPSNVKTPPSLPSIPQFMSILHGDKSATLPSVVDGYADLSPRIQKPSSVEYADFVRTENPVFPLENVQEACLLRYWIEEISHWVRRVGQPCHIFTTSNSAFTV